MKCEKLKKIIKDYIIEEKITIERVKRCNTIVSIGDSIIIKCLSSINKSSWCGLENELNNSFLIDFQYQLTTDMPFTEIVKNTLNIGIRNNYEEIMK